MIAPDKFSDTYLKFSRIFNQFDDQNEMLQLLSSEKQVQGLMQVYRDFSTQS